MSPLPQHISENYASDSSVMDYSSDKLREDHINDITKDGYTALHFSCMCDDPKRVEKLIEAGASINAKSWDGSTPLHYACFYGLQKIIEILLKLHCDVNAAMANGLTPLHVAAIYCPKESVKLLISSGAEIDSEDENGLTPLMLACKDREKIAIPQILISQGADINCRSRKGWTALHFAIVKSNRELINHLLISGADVGISDNKGRTPLHFAVHTENSDSNITVVKALCEYKPDLFLQFDNSKLLPVHYAAAFGNTICCVYFLEKMYAKDKASFYHSGLTPLHSACIYNQPDAVEAILNWESDRTIQQSLLEYADEQHRIPLHYAMREGNLACVKLLLQQNAKSQLNWYDTNGSTPLHLAAEADKTNCIEYCMKLPSDLIMINYPDNSKRTCGMIALTSCKSSPRQLIELSNKNHVDNNGRGYLHRAAAGKSLDCFEMLLKCCDVNARDKEDVTPLHIAAAVGQKDFVVRLLNAGASMNVFDTRGLSPADWAAAHGHIKILGGLLDPRRWTKVKVNVTPCLLSDKALILACKGGHFNVVVHILQKKACPLTATNHKGETALHCAAANGHYEVVELLADHGANLNSLDDNDHTPLMLSVAKTNHMHVTEMLINKGCDPLLKDFNGNTALHLAMMHKNEEAGKIIFESLLSYNDSDVLKATNNKGETYVHCAAQYGLSELLSVILPHSISSIFTKDNRGRYPICCGIEDENITDCIMQLYYYSFPDPEQDAKSPRKSLQLTTDQENDTF